MGFLAQQKTSMTALKLHIQHCSSVRVEEICAAICVALYIFVTLLNIYISAAAAIIMFRKAGSGEPRKAWRKVSPITDTGLRWAW